MKITAYVDESGRHDRTGKQIGSGKVVVAGWVDWRDNWEKFCNQWKSVLRKYDVRYFHFSEWADASAVARNVRPPSSSFSGNPYKGWSLDKLDAFLYEMAELAGGGQKLFVGGFISTKDFVEAKKYPEYSRFAPAPDPYQACLNQFFESFATEVRQQWPYWKEPVAFVFDHNDDSEWNHTVQSAFAASKRRDHRIAKLTFEDSKILPHLPLQAADMLCYRMRQIAEKFTDSKILPNPSRLDDLLIKPCFERATPSYLQATLGDFLSLLPLRYGDYPWRK